jgi:hypothetical protein
MNRAEPTIVFLVYESRSGSTRLATQLDRFSDIGVSVESDLMRILLTNRDNLMRAASAEEQIAILENAKGRFASLGVNRDLMRIQGSSPRFQGVEAIARAVLSAYFERTAPHAKAWILKDGADGFVINQLGKEFPQAKFLHVLRDGRAVLNSKLSAVRPYGRGERMARDPLTSAKAWCALVRHFDNYSKRHPDRCKVIRYEDMVADEARELGRVREFLGLPTDVLLTKESTFYDRMPSAERDIHRLVQGAPITKRTTAWRDELSRGDLLVFEWAAGADLEEHGYPRTLKNARAIAADPAFIGTLTRCWLRRVRGWMQLIANPARASHILRVKAIRRRDMAHIAESISPE